MSRRRGEFEHRTSIFEGAFRAWSHLGGLEPEILESKPATELDPLNYPIVHDPRLKSKGEGKDDNGKHRIYPYEPLPRSGLAHPYVQAILSPWLGPDADNDAIQLGLTTLRTWWQHRRKGESGSAVAALGTEKMKGVVEGYTRHFFTLAHCLVMNDKEQPPRSLHSKMKEVEKLRNKRRIKRTNDDAAGKLLGVKPGVGAGSTVAAGIAADLTNSKLTPLERLHVAQQRQLAVEGGVRSSLAQVNGDINPAMPIINIKNKCVASKVDLPAVVDEVTHRANQLAHSGSRPQPPTVPSTIVSGGPSSAEYGDPGMLPVVYVSDNGAILLAMSVDGITCAHCVKIVETVLKGCNGNKSPIDGLLDAAADRVLCSVLIKIDKISNAKRVAFESARNLAMVGYSAKAKEIGSTIERDGRKQTLSPETMFKAFDAVGRSDPKTIFDWTISCTCPDNGVLRDDCSRHSQMSANVFDAFETRRIHVLQYLAGAKLDAPPIQAQVSSQSGDQQLQQQQHLQPRRPQQMMNDYQPQPIMHSNGTGMPNMNVGQNAGLDLFGNDGGMGGRMSLGHPNNGTGAIPLNDVVNDFPSQRAQRNPSIISFGGGRNMSFASEASYGRAMSGLSALSIDWENMDDFDINVDHSAHINNAMNPSTPLGGGPLVGEVMLNSSPIAAGPGGGGARRSSLRHPLIGGGADNDQHVSFKV